VLITHEQLHSARWNFACTCTLTTCRTLLNFKVIAQRSRSHGFLVLFCLRDTAATCGQYLALSKACWYCFCIDVVCSVIYILIVQLHPLAQLNDATSQIYQSMRQSNGSNFFLNRKDTIVINGYLNKKSMSTVVCLVGLMHGVSVKKAAFLFLSWLGRMTINFHKISSSCNEKNANSKYLD